MLVDQGKNTTYEFDMWHLIFKTYFDKCYIHFYSKIVLTATSMYDGKIYDYKISYYFPKLPYWRYLHVSITSSRES